jgi:energy-coupling factor transporter transmembrane protein EcfT
MGTRLFRYMWLGIGIISVVDLCLAIEHRDVIHETEQNPIAKAIIVSCGLAVFSVVKILGTLAAMWFMLQAYRFSSKLGWALTLPIFLFQTWLLWYLLFSGPS